MRGSSHLASFYARLMELLDSLDRNCRRESTTTLWPHCFNNISNPVPSGEIESILNKGAKCWPGKMSGPKVDTAFNTALLLKALKTSNTSGTETIYMEIFMIAQRRKALKL